MTMITKEEYILATARAALDIPYSDTFEQAQTKIAKLRDAAPDLARAYIALHERVERLTEALEFYADHSNYGMNGPLDPNSGFFTGGPALAILKETAPVCTKCGGSMRPGIATGQTYTAGAPDFGPDDEISTMSVGGPGVVIPAMKCEQCGWSVTK